MTEHNDHQDGCLMCAVRALTEGEPPLVRLEQPGDEITGVVLRVGRRPDQFGDNWFPYVWLWTGDLNRVAVIGHAMTMRAGMMDADAKVGDTMTIRFEEKTEIQSGRFQGRPYHRYSVTVKRGH